MNNWSNLVKKVISPKNEVNIAFVGKYLDLKESYKSLTEALIHSGAHLDTKVNITWVDSDKLEDGEQCLSSVDGILVPGGFGERGVKGKLSAIKYARENKIPFLGICFGMQLAMIEFARNVLNIKDANSMEFDEKTKNPIVYLIDEFIDASGKKQLRTFQSPLGGTMRLGGYKCQIKKDTLLSKVYGGAKEIRERHRHRFEANPDYKDEFEKNGMIVSGQSNGLIEVVEISDHPWFLGVQFHPEFTSRLTSPNPAILSFVEAVLDNKND